MNQQILAEKKENVAKLNELLKNSHSAVVVSYSALPVAEVNELRAALKKEGAYLSVHKNTLLKKACDEDGLSELDALLKGPTALVTSAEAGNGLQALSDFANGHKKKFSIKGGMIDGSFCDAEALAELASVGGKEGALARFLSVLQGPLVQFALTIKAVGEKNDPAGAAALSAE
ncbi:MAG: 50S ribosomal protein L10 [Bacilli bacterium]|jgi:large subunit ribosomal protein L10|nr:50S ribosomal protein L10 [Bacilli bacterium]